MNEIKLSNPDIAYTPSVVTYDFILGYWHQSAEFHVPQ